MKLALFLCLLLAQSAFAVYGPRVDEAREGFVVSLHLQDKEKTEYDYFCSGVLISPTQVLTAGHCIDGMGGEAYDYSHALVHYPSRLVIKVGGKKIKARSVEFSKTYFEGSGFDSEDLALIELAVPVRNIPPVRLARKTMLKAGRTVTFIARNKKSSTKLAAVRDHGSSTVLLMEKSAGACLGDSGGAVVIHENGQQLLAGIIMYDGNEVCYKKTNYAYFFRGLL